MINLKHLFFKGVKNPAGAVNLIMNLPKLLKLYYRLFKDPRTPLHLKLVLVLAIAYSISPLDLIPDFLMPLIGQIDDLIVLFIAFRYFLKNCPPELVLEHIEAIEGERMKS